MKKMIFSALCALGLWVTTGQVQAQETFEKGLSMLNIGIGWGAKTSDQTVPPLSVGYERSIVDGLIDQGSLGLGVEFEYQGFRHPDKRGNLAMFIGPRFSFHYEFVPNLDTYITTRAGLELYPKIDGTALRFSPNISLGGRYLVSDRFGVFGEIGTGLSVFRLGMTFNLGGR